MKRTLAHGVEFHEHSGEYFKNIGEGWCVRLGRHWTASDLRTIADDIERREREAKMRAAGHVPPSDDEAQATFDATIAAMERDPP